MRSRLELFVASCLVVLCCGMTWRHLHADPPNGSKCGGHRDCVVDSCVNQPAAGYSCGMVTPVDNPICGFGSSQDNCDPVDLPCAEIEYYSGGSCAGDPSACPGVSLGVSDTYESPSCEYL